MEKCLRPGRIRKNGPNQFFIRHIRILKRPALLFPVQKLRAGNPFQFRHISVSFPADLQGTDKTAEYRLLIFSAVCMHRQRLPLHPLQDRGLAGLFRQRSSDLHRCMPVLDFLYLKIQNIMKRKPAFDPDHACCYCSHLNSSFFCSKMPDLNLRKSVYFNFINLSKKINIANDYQT